MAIVWLSGLGGAAAIVNTSPLIRLRPLRQATPLIVGMAPIAAPVMRGIPIEFGAEIETYLPPPVALLTESSRLETLSFANWRVFDLDFTFFLTSAFFKSEGCDSVAYLH